MPLTVTTDLRRAGVSVVNLIDLAEGSYVVPLFAEGYKLKWIG
jgi:hypothetical protein